MNSLLIYLLSLSAVVEGNLQSIVKQDNLLHVKEVIRDCLLSTTTHNVIAVLDERYMDNRTIRISSGILNTIAEYRPMQTIAASTDSWPEHMYATSYTLYVGIAAILNYPIKTENFKYLIDGILSTMSRPHYPKILLAVFVNQQIKEFREFFESVLRVVDLLDITILEIWLNGDLGENSVLIHRYNPFNKTYYKTPFIEKGISWFPDKTKNLYGSEFVIGTSRNYYMEYDGEVISVFDTDPTMAVLKTAMNFTNVFEVRDLSRKQYHLLHPTMPYRSIYQGKVDYSIPLEVNRDCLAMPLIKKIGVNNTYLNMIVTVITGSSIIALLFAAMIIFRVHPDIRHPVVILGSILNISWPRSPSSRVEKIFFFLLIIVGCRYTAMFYTELFNTAIEDIEIYDIKDFEELEKSGLFFTVGEEYIENFDFTSYPKLKEKIIPVKFRTQEEQLNFIESLTKPEAYNNTGHFLGGQYVQSMLFVAAINAGNVIVARITDFCIGVRPVFYLFKFRNPYKERLNELFIRTMELGFHQKHSIVTDAIKQTANLVDNVNRDLAKKGTLPVVPYMFCAYIIGLVVLAGEVVFYHIQRTFWFRQ